MKKLLLSAAALAVVLSVPAAYADDQNGNNDNKAKQERVDRPDRPDKGDQNGPGGQMSGPGQNGNGPGGGMDRNRDTTNNNNRDRDNTNNADRDRGNMNDRDRDNNRKVVVHKTVDRSVVLKVRANITAPHRFHAAKIYMRPPGWYPHRWVFGERLPRAFFAPDYFILDFSAYGLLAPWDGYEWVRYGNDALLIDLDTGEVIRVEYDIFY